MDRVRFGRALGQGTREAARALFQAADAATASNPSPSQPRSAAPSPSRSSLPSAARPAQKIRTAQAGFKEGSKRFGEAVWGPVAKLSGVLWLEVTGVLFSLFAMVAGLEAWRHRLDVHASGTARNHLLAAVLMFVLFGFFTVDSFVRARRRSRR